HRARSRTADFHGEQHPAGSLHDDVPLLPAGDDAVGNDVPGREHAGFIAVPDVARSDSTLPGDRPGRVSPGLGLERADAPDPRADRVWSGDTRILRDPVPQDDGVDQRLGLPANRLSFVLMESRHSTLREIARELNLPESTIRY